ncbi:MAG: hypothetical protein ACRD0K_10145 [Egibacteraceae bacterium]
MYGDLQADYLTQQKIVNALALQLRVLRDQLAAAKARGESPAVLANIQAGITQIEGQHRTALAKLQALADQIAGREQPSGISLGIADVGEKLAELLKKLGTGAAVALAALLIMTFARRR